MELCQCNLEHLLKELKSADRTLYEWEIGIIIKQILEAIFYMHKEKVLHRYMLTQKVYDDNTTNQMHF